jgi:hypothetical protein
MGILALSAILFIGDNEILINSNRLALNMTVKKQLTIFLLVFKIQIELYNSGGKLLPLNLIVDLQVWNFHNIFST